MVNQEYELMTQQEYAAYRGVSPAMISKYIKGEKIRKESMTKVKENGRVYKRVIKELADIDLKNNLDPAQTNSIDKVKPEPDTKPISEIKKMSFEQARTKNEIIKSELNMLKLRIEQGELVESETIKNQAFKAGRVIRDAIESIPVRVAANIAAETDQFKCQKMLEAEFKNILNDLMGILTI